MPNRSKHEVPNHLQTSLEEAVVSRPGRKAGEEFTDKIRALKARHKRVRCTAASDVTPAAPRHAMQDIE